MPFQPVLGEEVGDATDPTFDHRFAATLGIGRTLEHFEAHRLAIFPNRASLGGRRSTVSADENHFAHG
jgi:hypothetical protein